jgi:uncharacterized protein (TIGR00369 family)
MSQFKNVEDSQITISDLMLPSYSNFGGKIHGGHILNLMDQVAFACASKHSGHYCVTASVNKVNFLNPVEVGELLTMKASVVYTGNSSMVVGLRVESENIQTGKIKHCNSSYFTMVAKDENGNKAQVPGLILDTFNKARRFARSITRQEQNRERNKEFRDEDFVLAEYIDILKERNVKIVDELLGASS